MTRPGLPRRRGCRGCPLRAPSGACRDSAIKSGRCGSWVWYVVGNQQRRRLWAKPRNPRTPRQQHWRRRFGTASRKYNQSLTEEQQDACIAAGAKQRCRPRLGPSGSLTGQQYLVRREYAERAERSMQDAEPAAKGMQTQGISASTPGTHRHIAGITPGHRRRDAGRGGKDEGRRKSETGRRWREEADSQAPQRQIVMRSGCLRPTVSNRGTG